MQRRNMLSQRMTNASAVMGATCARPQISNIALLEMCLESDLDSSEQVWFWHEAWAQALSHCHLLGCRHGWSSRGVTTGWQTIQADGPILHAVSWVWAAHDVCSWVFLHHVEKRYRKELPLMYQSWCDCYHIAAKLRQIVVSPTAPHRRYQAAPRQRNFDRSHGFLEWAKPAGCQADSHCHGRCQKLRRTPCHLRLSPS